MRRLRLLVALICPLLLLFGLFQPAGAAETHIAARLVVPDAVSPDGTSQIAIRMDPEKGWHGYWSNPGDAGLGMQLEWDVPDGVSLGEPRYPVPETLLIEGLMNHVYEHEYALMVPVTLAPDLEVGSRLPIRLSARWLACTDAICVPESAEIAAEITVGVQGEGAVLPKAFDDWNRQLPAPLDAPARFEVAGDALRLAIPLPAETPLDAPHVFIGADRVVDYAAMQVFSRSEDTLIVRIARAGFEPLTPDELTGVLRLDGLGNGIAFTAEPGLVPEAGEPIGGDGAARLPSLPWLLLAAVAGGLLLNVMPCVFPILSLKALSLARAGESEAHARIEGLAYAAGVFVACLALGGVLLVLRAAGEQVGWAFQLQEPLVVVALLLLASAITANLLGLFEFAVPGFARAGSPQGAFATGLLAAFVATPCTGPFMASAMGAALLLPTGPALALFAALGLGIALPFLAVAFVPALRRRLPRPGAWMTRFRRWMAVPMGLTVLALAWLVWRIGGDAFALLVLLVLALVLVALLAAGKAQRRGRSARPAALLALVAGAAGLALLPAPASVVAGGESILDPRPFSEAALAKARAEGKPVFVWMTADWCLTCKVNERVAIEREETRAAFDAAGVVVLRGDWTRRDPEITRYLTEQGAAGVPLYVWYDGKRGGQEAEQLPQVLTPQMLADKAAGRT